MASSMKDIKNRIKSIEGTMQITKAMELVATSKFKKAKQRVETVRPYYEMLSETIETLGTLDGEVSEFFLKKENAKTCYVIIAGDRGLAGGFNANLFKKIPINAENEGFCAVPIGKKAYEYCIRNKIDIFVDTFGVAEEVSISDCYTLSNLLCKAFADGEIGSVCVAYTRMISMLSQEPEIHTLLPLERKKEKAKLSVTIYEPSSYKVFKRAGQCFVAGSIYGALAESQASELAARRMAMDSATKNAGEMIDTLTLNYNRARQAAITQEITEIVSGAEAL